jgi:hypothetical protein
MSPTLVWGIFQRGLGLVFLVSFVSLAREAVEMGGSKAVWPIAPRLAKYRQDFPSWRRFYYFPTLLWLNSSDAMLRTLTLLGAGASLLVIWGGAWSPWALLACYVCYLSLDLALVLVYPWDCVLFECALLGVLLPATHALPNLHALTAPAPALTWAYRLLLFRLMFGFGKQKFIGSRPKDLAYLKGFLIAQPLPSPLGWYAQKLPVSLLKGAVLFMFFVEIIAPFFAFLPGPLSVVFAIGTMLLMVGIHLCGTFGYFSLVTIVASIPLFDNVTPNELKLGTLFSSGEPILINAFVALHTCAAGLGFLFNTWLSHSWPLWSFWYRLPLWAQPLFALCRALHGFRWMHAYGVFPPFNLPAAKITTLMEATWDRQHWHELEFHYSPSNPRSPPRFIAPHHPRTDQAIIYDAFGLTPQSLMSSIAGPWDPYYYGSRSLTLALCQSVLRGEARHAVKGSALDAHPTPPVSVRLTTIMLEPASLEEHRKTGIWWKRRYVGPHTPPQELDPDFREDALAEPELWHFDAIFWRRRSKLNSLMRRARASDVDPMELVLADASGISEQDVARFWNEFVPLIQGQVRESFDTLPDVVEAFKARFDRKQQRALHRLLGRFSLLVIARLEPLYLHRYKPVVPAKTYFHLWMLVHHVIGCGKSAYLEAFERPESIVKHLPDLTNQTGLYAHSVFRFDDMIFEAQKLRLMEAYAFPHDLELKRLHDLRLRDETHASCPPVERFVYSMGRKVSGFFWTVTDLRDAFKGPRFDGGVPEHYPIFTELDSGEVIVNEAVRPAKPPAPGVVHQTGTDPTSRNPMRGANPPS